MDQKYDGDVCGLHRRFAGRGLVYVKCCTRNSSRQDKDRHIKIAYTYAITWNCKTKCSSQVPICLYSRLCSSTHLHSIYISMMMLMMIRLDIDEWMSIILSFSIHSFIPHFFCVCVYPSMMMMIIIIIFYKCLTNNPIISYVYFKWFEIEVQMFCSSLIPVPVVWFIETFSDILIYFRLISVYSNIACCILVTFID